MQRRVRATGDLQLPGPNCHGRAGQVQSTGLGLVSPVRRQRTWEVSAS
jgi:hypothetical protein